jgi:hypothetical protein
MILISPFPVFIWIDFHKVMVQGESDENESYMA